MFIHLYRIIFQDGFNGKFNITLRFLTRPYRIIMNTSDYYLTPSNSSNFTLKKTLYMRDLDDRVNFNQIINEILSEILRYFGCDIVRANSQLERYQNTINQDLDTFYSS